jgi:hypothetical protein
MVDILDPLLEEELEELARRCPDRNIEAGEFIYTTGDTNERLFVLKRGKVRRSRWPWWAMVRRDGPHRPASARGSSPGKSE